MTNTQSSSVLLAGLRYAVPEYFPIFRDFVSIQPSDCDGQITASGTGFADGTERLFASQREISVYRLANGGWLYLPAKKSCRVEVVSDGGCCNISYYLPEQETGESSLETLSYLIRSAVECCFCRTARLSLHSACVELPDEGSAVAFTGTSGLGKSTRAKAWVDGLGAKWISGDRPAVRLDLDEAAVCGVPWDGKEKIYRPAQLPLRAILEVRRSPSNYLRKLTVSQKQKLLVRQCFIPMWDAEASSYAMINIKRLIKKVPVYRVFCGQDARDAALVYDILYRHPEKILEESEDMKIKDGFVLKNILDEHLVMPTGENIEKFNGAVALNGVSAFLFEKLQNPMSRGDLVSALLEEYDVDEATAARDVDALMKKFSDMGILDD